MLSLIITVLLCLLCLRSLDQTHRCEAFVTKSVTDHRHVGIVAPRQAGRHPRLVSRPAVAGSTDDGADDEVSSAPDRVYLDVSVVEDESSRTTVTGRLVFAGLRGSRSLLPRSVDNLVRLCDGSARSIDPRCDYVRCRFRHSPQFVEGFPQYRWAHVLDGRGVSSARGGERVTDDPEDLRRCARTVYGGTYYGLEYAENNDDDDDDSGVLLTVPLVGAQRGLTGLSIVRVGESPPEWRERLLLNSAVLGYLESGVEILRAMARQTDGPPTVVASGTL